MQPARVCLHPMGKEFRQIIDAIAQQAAAVSGSRPDVLSLLIAQRISISLQRETARAILRRRVEHDFSSVAEAPDRPAILQTDLWQ